MLQVIEDRSKAETRAAETVLIQRGYNLFDVGVSRLVLTKYIPEHLMSTYVRLAMKKVAAPKQLEDGTWYAEIPELTGIWANGEDLKQCLDELEEVLLDWLLIKIEHEDRDIPIMDGIDLNVIR